MSINLKKNIGDRVKVVKAPTGYSFTTLFFGFLVPLCRKMDLSTAFKLLVFSFITFGISNIFFAAYINDEYLDHLYENGYSKID